MNKKIIIVFFFLSNLCLHAQLRQNESPPYAMYDKLKISDIQPQGWIKEFLERQNTGLTGNIEVAGYPFNTCLWACEKMKGSQAAWWPYEQTAYYLDGANRLGYLIRNNNLVQKVKSNTRYVQDYLRYDGRFGTVLSDRWWRWPYASFNRNFMLEYELTHNKSIIDMLQKHYLTFTANDFGDDLELANVEELCWLYGVTKDKRLIDMAEEAYHLFKVTPEYHNFANSDIDFTSHKAPDHHAVIYLELLKIPAILYSYTGKKEYLDEALNGMRTMEKHHMLVSGLPSSTEHFEGISELAGTETCNTATFPYTYGYFLRITGNVTLADKIEKAVFNGGIGSITKDFKAHQYFSSPNQVIATAISNPFGHHPARMAFCPGHDVECCTGNVNRFMPYYVEQMWLSTRDNGIVAALFGPSSVKAKVGKSNTSISITEQTTYPFSEIIDFKIEASQSVSFPFYIRIPEWCSESQVLVNGKVVAENVKAGSFYKLDQNFDNNDLVSLKIPMKVKITEWPNNGIAIERGPLAYSLAISADKKILENYEKSTKEFPSWEMRPNETWSYALDLTNGQADVEFLEHKGYPWDEGNSPIKIKVPARKLSHWELKEVYDEKWEMDVVRTPGFPKQTISSTPTEYIELVPYGSTLLRLSVFPKYSNKIK